MELKNKLNNLGRGIVENIRTSVSLRLLLNSKNIKARVAHPTFNPNARSTTRLKVAALAGFAMMFSPAWGQISKHTQESDASIRETLKSSSNTIWFQENRGQLPSEVLYSFRTSFGAMFVFNDHLQLSGIKATDIFKTADSIYSDQGALRQETHTVNISFKGGNSAFQVVPMNELVTKVNYFKGNDPSKWATNISSYGELLLKEVYPGIDLRLYSDANGTIEFDWILASAADFAKIKMVVDGQDDIVITENGNFSLKLRMANLDFKLPESYQIIDGIKHPVSVKYYKSAPNELSFTTFGIINPKAPLVIDPTVLWGNYFDENDNNFDAYSYAVEVDSCGNTYVASTTNVSIASGYRNGATGYDVTFSNNGAFIYRMNANGTTIDFFTYVDENDIFTDIGIFPGGNVGVIGYVGVTNTTYPLLNAFSTDAAAEGVISIFSNNLGTLIYSSRLPGAVTVNTLSVTGGGGTQLGPTTIEIVSANDYYISGVTTYSLAGFPSSGVVDNSRTGEEAYIARFNGTNYNNKLWATYIGGDNNEEFIAIKLDLDKQNLGFVGYTSATSNAGFPAVTSGVVDNVWAGTEGWVGSISNSTSAPTAFQMLSYLGGAGDEERGVIDCDSNNMYILGMSRSTNYPGTTVSGVYRGTHYFNNANTTNYDLVITRIPFSGTTGFRSTYLGGTADEFSGGIVFNTQDNNLYYFSTSDQATGGGSTQFPTQNTNPPSNYFDNTHGGNNSLDIAVGSMNSNLTTLIYSSFIGGTGDDYLGSTGVLKGSGHYDFNSASNIYALSTTVHSTLSTSLIAATGNFDGGKSNGGDDAHILLKMNLSSSDMGDAPLTYESGNRAEHGFNPAAASQLRLGSQEDAETENTRNALATGDDVAVSGANQCATNGDDEDGVTTWPTLTVESTGNYTVTVSTGNSTGSGATLHGWIDFDGDGSFETTEYTSASVANGATSANMTWNLTGRVCPTSIAGGRTYARLRITSTALTDSTGTSVDERSRGIAANGEVEDYAVYVRGRDYSDLPLSYGSPSAMVLGDLDVNYQPEDAGAIWLGTRVDIERDCAANNTATANGDDLEFTDDEDGLVLPPAPIKQNTSYTFPLTFSNSTAGSTKFYGMWIDWNADGDFTDATDGFYNGSTTGASVNVSVTTPLAANLNPRFAVRVIARTTSLSSTDFNAVFANGEIEDYIFDPGILISGTVFDDGDGTFDNQIDGAVLNRPSNTQLWAYLVNASNNIIDSIAVAANGTYQLQGATPSTANLSVRISTSRAALAAAAPAANLPSNWVSVGDGYGVNNAAGTGIEANTATSNSIVPVTTGTSPITGLNFGLNLRPQSFDTTAAPQVNLGGTTQHPVIGVRGYDLEQGMFLSSAAKTLIIETLPGNATLYYNGVAVTLGQVINNYNASLLTVDPTFTGNGTVVFTYAWRDSAQQKDLSPATVTLPFDQIRIGGTVYHDANGNVNANVDGTVTNTAGGQQVWAYLIGSGNVLDSARVLANGTYLLDAASSNTTYTVLISTTRQAVVTSAPAVAFPTNWAGTGEEYGVNNSAGSGLESGLSNSQITVTTSTSNVTGVDFGIEYIPLAHSKKFNIEPDSIYMLTGRNDYSHFLRLNASSGTSDTTVNSVLTTTMPGKVSGFDLEDGRFDGAIGANADTIVFTALPDSSNTMLVYKYLGNDVLLIPNPAISDPSFQFWDPIGLRYQIPNFNAANLLMFFKMNYQLADTFRYAYKDAAGRLGTDANYIISYNASPLPLHWLSFTAKKSSNNTVSLNWTAITDEEASFFDVQRSTDAQNWNSIGSEVVRPTADVSQYMFVDNSTENLHGVVYYRIQLNDVDGHKSNSAVRSVVFQDKSVLPFVKVYPNPTSSSINIETSLLTGFDVRVLNDKGQVVLVKKSLDPGTILELSDLPSGNYNVQVVSEGLNQNYPIVVIK